MRPVYSIPVWPVTLVFILVFWDLPSVGYGAGDPLTSEERTWLNQHDGKIIVNKKVEKELVRSEQKWHNILADTPQIGVALNARAEIIFANAHFLKLTGWKEEDVIGRDWDCNDIPTMDLHGSNSVSIEATMFPVLNPAGEITNVVLNWIDISEQKKLEAQLHQVRKMESVGRLAGGVAHDFNNMLSVIIGNIEFVLEDLDATHLLIDIVNEINKAAKRSADLTRQLLAFARKQTIAPEVIDLNQTIEGMLKMLGRLIGEDIDLAWRPKMDLWPVRIDPSQIDQVLANLSVNARLPGLTMPSSSSNPMTVRSIC